MKAIIASTTKVGWSPRSEQQNASEFSVGGSNLPLSFLHKPKPMINVPPKGTQ